MSDELEQPEPLQPPEEDLLTLAIRQNMANHFLIMALIQTLIDNKVLKGQEDEIMRELDRRAHDLQRDEATELRLKQYVREIQLSFSKLPKQ